MLKQSLFELAIATSLSSDALAELFKAQLVSAANKRQAFNLDRDTFANDCRKVLAQALDRDYPRRFRLNELQLIFDTLWPKDMFRSRNIPQLSSVFERLLIENGDIIHYRDNCVQQYSRFMARFDPSVVVGWRLAERINQQPMLRTHDVLRIVTAQQPMFSPPPVSDKPYAENHTHLGGMHYDGLVLVAGLLGREDNFFDSPQRQLLSPLFRLTNVLLRHADELDNRQPDEHLPELMGQIEQALGQYWVFSGEQHLAFSLYAEQNIASERVSLTWLRRQLSIALQGNALTEAWLWLQLWLWHCYQTVDHYYLRMAIVYLISSLMSVRRQLIMDGQGLSRFVEYYGRPLRRKMGKVADQQLDGLKRLFQGERDVAEIKVINRMFNPDDVGQIMTHLAQVVKLKQPNMFGLFSEGELAEYQQLMDRWHFCIHFVRAPMFRHNPEAVWQVAQQLRHQCDQQSNWHTPVLRPEQHLLTGANPMPSAKQLVPSRWVRGLDVAGDENVVKTEIYAPALRWLRQGLRAKPDGLPADRGFHFSIHIGEDYAHPLSGLRHVDESVQFCQMHAGDRLGHALALGISPKDWVERHGEIVLPVDEHLDNLVWAWHQASALAARLALAAQVMPMLERRILRIAPMVPWVHLACIGMLDDGVNRCGSQAMLKDITPEILFTAWQLRRNCHFAWQQYSFSPIDNEQNRIALPDIDKLSDNDNLATRLYLNRWRWQVSVKGTKDTPSLGCQRVKPLANVLINLCAEQQDSQAIAWQHFEDKALNVIHDQHSPQEVEFFHALQDGLLDQYDQMGLIIEVNPTSNVCIANVESHCDHPVFRWYPPDLTTLECAAKNNLFGLRRGPIKVCINTDDAGIMPTTLRTEFRLLEEAAISHSVTRTDAQAWLERIRIFGLEAFNRNHLTVME